MRRTVFEDELAALWAEAGPRAVPRPRLAAHHHLALRGLVVASPAVQSLCLRNATVQAGTGAVWTGRGNWLALSSAARPDLPPPSAAGKAPGEASGEALWALWPGGARTADQPADRTSDRAPGWRARFLLEDLPQLLLATHRAPPGTPVLIAADLPPEARQAIGALLPGHPLRVLAPDESLRIPRLHAATIGSLAGLELTPHSLEAITRLRATVPPGGAERVLLWHGGLSRRLRNAPALRQMLEAQGFVTAETDRLSLTERIQALSMAREVIVPDPDCGTDSLFAPPGARILPLLPAEEGLETALHLWTLLGDLAGMEVTAILGSAPYRRLRTRFLPGHRGRVFHVDPALILPFVPAAGPPPDLPLRQSLDALYGSSGAADVLTGAWAVHAGPTPAGFEDRLRHLRRRAALGISAVAEADLAGLMAHPFFADFARSIRSGFPVLAGLDGDEAALAAQLRASFAG
ncbi:hypothetical protein, partial [Neotabrizicola sp. VNH66]|uniref:hypothetical protein n=1 Tax=Neotabrizicola sp. VNH66 TaxID=3400918 RepID=UPI003BFB5CA4